VSAAITVGQLLHEAARTLDESGSDTPRLDAEVLLGHVLGVDRATLLAAPEALVGEGAAQTFRRLVERRTKGEPVSYIRGLKEFYGLAFAVDPRALIPRPETELLVDRALAWIGAALTVAPRPPGTAPLQVLDVGTGSGAIAVTLAVEARRRGWSSDLRIVATDSSREALSLAIENAVGHGVADSIDFAPADLTPDATDPASLFDLVTANLPYIPTDDVPKLPIAASFEPVGALDGGPDGLTVIRHLVGLLPDSVRGGGVALLEIGADQADRVLSLAAERLPEWHAEIHADLAGRPRVAELRRPS
jgi:release factor glutamine methyltransferase